MKCKRDFRFRAITGLVLVALLMLSCSKPVPASGGGQNGSPQPAATSAAKPSGGQGQGSSGQGGGRRAAIIPVQAVVVQVGLLRADRTTAGIVVPVVQSQVATQVAGFVAKVSRSVGDWVEVGDVIIQLDDSQLKLTLANAQAALENAKINYQIGSDTASQANPKLALQVQSAQAAYDAAKKFYDGQKALFDLGGISASALDTANSQLTAAQANLAGAKTALDQNNNSADQSIAQLKIAVQQAQNAYDQARLNLQNTSIKAPFAGQIAALNMQLGMYANVSTPVFTLVSAERQINFNIPPSDASYLSIGMALAFHYSGKSYEVRVKQSPSAPIGGILTMVARADGLNFQYGTVGEINYSIPLSQGALVPIAALDTLENQNFVFAIENGRAVVKNVSITGESGTTASVTGVLSGDTIIVSPPPGLILGSQVQPTMMAAQGALASGTPQSAAAAGGGSQATGASSGQASGNRQGQSGTYQGQGQGGGNQGQRQGQGGNYQGQGQGGNYQGQGQGGNYQGQGQGGGNRPSSRTQSTNPTSGSGTTQETLPQAKP